MTLRCGPFTLTEPIAQGGMAVVWHGHHGKLPVAVKFVTLGARGRELFADEVRSHAKLDHPHILRVLDFGIVHHRLADIEPGTPWMALEYASAGHLGDLADSLRWPGVEVVALALLDALSYAHSHGVIHRDLKLPNILLSGSKDVRPGLKLADFGIAHMASSDQEGEYEARITGTVNAMAPEQCCGAFREYGPWTDIYALGCLVYRLTAGRWPFSGLRGRAALNAHIVKEAPPLNPRIAIPPGLAEWLSIAMDKRPGSRFQNAADAAHALLQLEHAEGPRDLTHPVLVESQASASSAFSVWTGLRSAPSLQARAPIAPFPSRWERPARPPPGVPLVDAGLELYPLRLWPAVGREAERGELWRLLGEVRSTQRAQAVILRGVEGSGVSHLGSWIAQHAEGMGAARTFSVVASPDDAPTEALTRLLGDALRCHGLHGPELERVIEASLAIYGTHDASLTSLLTELLTHGGSHSVRRGALRRVLTEGTRGRAGVMWVDDAVHCHDALSFVTSSLRNAWSAPILFVLGVGEAQSAAIEGLEASPGVTTLRIDGLGAGEMSRLLQYVLPMEAGLHAKVLEDAEGLPGRAALQLDGLVRRRKLSPTPFGYALAEGAFSRTTGLADAEEERVEDLLADLPDGAEIVLERAAILGFRVSHEAWSRVCDDPAGDRPTWEIPIEGTRVRFTVIEALKQQDLAREEGEEWRFVRPAFRRAVLARMPYLRLEASHFAAAQYLATVPSTPERMARRARHLRDAGLMEQAAALFLKVLDEGPRSTSLLVLCQEALDLFDGLGLPPGDVRRGEVRLCRVGNLATRQAHQAALEAEALVADAAEHGWPEIEAVGISELASAVFVLGDRTLALDLCGDALAAARATGVIETLARVAIPLGTTYRLAGRPRQAVTLLEEIEQTCLDQGLVERALRLQAELAVARYQAGTPTPIPKLEQLIEATHRAGYLTEVASLQVLAGELSRVNEDADAARRFYEASVTTQAMIGQRTTLPMANLATLALAADDADPARHWLDRAQREDAHSPGGLWDAAFTTMELEWAVLVEDLATAKLRCSALEPKLRTQRHVPDIVCSLTRTIARLHALDSELARAVSVHLVEYNRIGQARTEGI